MLNNFNMMMSGIEPKLLAEAVNKFRFVIHLGDKLTETAELADVVLIDTREGIPQGKALDLSQLAAIEGFEHLYAQENGGEAGIRPLRLLGGQAVRDGAPLLAPRQFEQARAAGRRAIHRQRASDVFLHGV